MLDNPMRTGLQAHQTRTERRDALYAKAYQELRCEFVTALFANTLTEIQTPGFSDGSMRALEVVGDLISSREGAVSVLDSMLRLVTVCAEGEDPATRLPAQALIARMAHHHATYHAGDLADSEGFGDAQ